MTLLIFQTNIKSKQKLNRLSPIFNSHSGILEWSIDQEDIDNVLRIEARTNTTEQEIIGLVKAQGFDIAPLMH